jgi:hypothetical protein
MATVIDVEQPGTDLSGLYHRALGGKESVFARGTGPKLKLVVDTSPPQRTGKRELGRFRGRIREAPGVWDPMTDEELREIGLL